MVSGLLKLNECITILKTDTGLWHGTHSDCSCSIIIIITLTKIIILFALVILQCIVLRYEYCLEVRDCR